MFIFIANPSFSEFVTNSDTFEYLKLVQHSGEMSEPMHKNIQNILYLMLKNIYELGDFVVVEDGSCALLFCAQYKDDNFILNEKFVNKSLEKLKKYSDENLPDDYVLTFVIPSLRTEKKFEEFIEEFKNLYIESEVNKNLQVVRIDFMNANFNMGTKH